MELFGFWSELKIRLQSNKVKVQQLLCLCMSCGVTMPVGNSCVPLPSIGYICRSCVVFVSFFVIYLVINNNSDKVYNLCRTSYQGMGPGYHNYEEG